MKNIILTGFMGTGKTVLARTLARDTGRTYISTDDMIEQREGRSINDIFRDSGESYFRKIEKEIVKEVAKSTDHVIDTGGGVVLDNGNVTVLKESGIMICLWADPQVIYDRTKRHWHRPLLNVDDPKTSIKETLDQRRSFYEKADLHVDTTELNINEVTEKIKRMLDEKEKNNIV